MTDSAGGTGVPAHDAEGDLLRRLRLAEGQLRGIQRMVAEGRACEEIVTQLLAVRAAVERMVEVEINSDLENCMRDVPAGAAERVARLVGMMSKSGTGGNV